MKCFACGFESSGAKGFYQLDQFVEGGILGVDMKHFTPKVILVCPVCGTLVIDLDKNLKKIE